MRILLLLIGLSACATSPKGYQDPGAGKITIIAIEDFQKLPQGKASLFQWPTEENADERGVQKFLLQAETNGFRFLSDIRYEYPEKNQICWIKFNLVSSEETIERLRYIPPEPPKPARAFRVQDSTRVYKIEKSNPSCRQGAPSGPAFSAQVSR